MWLLWHHDVKPQPDLHPKPIGNDVMSSIFCFWQVNLFVAQSPGNFNKGKDSVSWRYLTKRQSGCTPTQQLSWVGPNSFCQTFRPHPQSHWLVILEFWLNGCQNSHALPTTVVVQGIKAVIPYLVGAQITNETLPTTWHVQEPVTLLSDYLVRHMFLTTQHPTHQISRWIPWGTSSHLT